MRISRQMQRIVDDYREFLEPTATGDSVEMLLQDSTSMQVNAPRAFVAASVKSQVLLLERLHLAGLLRRDAAEAEEPSDG